MKFCNNRGFNKSLLDNFQFFLLKKLKVGKFIKFFFVEIMVFAKFHSNKKKLCIHAALTTNKKKPIITRHKKLIKNLNVKKKFN